MATNQDLAAAAAAATTAACQDATTKSIDHWPLKSSIYGLCSGGRGNSLLKYINQLLAFETYLDNSSSSG
uniref:Putative secreted protein n=1 Tax=Anopheles darlingi TaxID=43151 RepID=A0A2M4DMJ1_ANODA